MKDTENRARTVTVVKKADESEGESKRQPSQLIVEIRVYRSSSCCIVGGEGSQPCCHDRVAQ